MRSHLCSLVVALFGLALPALAEVTLPSVIGSGMVLQRGAPLPIWGWAAPGEKVTVSFAGQTAEAVAGEDGAWRVTLKPIAEANAIGQAMTIAGANTIALADVLIGDVWVCSGQSNMQWSVSSSLNRDEEIASADLPAIRLFTVPNVTADSPQSNCKGAWSVCSPKTVPGFSAVGYFFGRHLHRELGVPIGLINTSWGGTIAEAWTSAPALRTKLPEFGPALDKLTNQSESAEKALEAYREAMADFTKIAARVNEIEADMEAAAKRAAPTYDDSQWKVIEVPGNWEERGMPGVDGVVWMRKTVNLPETWAGKPVILRPGPIDEIDVTWFNGVRVGGQGLNKTRDVSFWNVPREYHVPGELVKAGANVIAIRIIDMAGQGGLWGGAASSMVVELADGKKALADELEADPQTTVPLAGAWRIEAELALPPRPINPNQPNRPSVLFNGMIAPLIPFAIKGAIWYQGESNAGRPDQYRTLLPTLIADWRARWEVGDFPFLIVQLANFMAAVDDPVQDGWAALREAQSLTAANDPKVGLALAIDIGEAKDIHPKNKQEVGRRLGLAAQAIAYGQKVPYSGPVFKAMEIKDGKAILSFSHADGGLVAKGDKLTGFAIRGKEGPFVHATATIVGETVVVEAEGIAEPVAIRYGWANNPPVNLYNGAGLPADPFRTDAP